MGICKIEGCQKEAKAKGLCGAHYMRWKRHGNPNTITKNRCGYSSRYPKLYNIFWAMHNRCEKPNNLVYKYYGARGIRVCKRWSGLYGLQNFIDDMGEPPKGHSLDRINVNGDYCPENCRWTDKYTQANNTSASKRKYSRHPGVTYNKIHKYWAAYIKINGKRYTKNAHSEVDAIEKRKELELKYLGRIL